MQSVLKKVIMVLSILVLMTIIFAQDRFPRPEFDSQYTKPLTTAPAPVFYDILDVTVLTLALLLATWFILKSRSRNSLFLLSIASLFYFGFWREGCICPVGSIQNMTLALFNPAYVIPVTVILFFTLPLLFALFTGRTFCSGVCPLGAIQELVLLKPVKLPQWMTSTLGLIPYVFIGLGVLYAATDGGFIICQLDPFVGFFRFSAEPNMIIYGALFLGVSVFVGRPYCRFLCPYGVLLGWMSKFSFLHLSITPDQCTQCRLCENACPYDAIKIPTSEKDQTSRQKAGERLIPLLLVTLLLTITGAVVGYFSHEWLASKHRVVSLAEQVILEKELGLETTLASRTFHESGQSLQELLTEADGIRSTFKLGSLLLGAFIGLVLGTKTMGALYSRPVKDYEADRTSCFSCGRCMPYCPDEHERQKHLDKRDGIYESIG